MKSIVRFSLSLILAGVVGVSLPIPVQRGQGAVNNLINVNNTADLPDANPSDGICEATAGLHNCTLRAAVMEANNHSGSIIVVPVGTYLLARIAAHPNGADAGSLKIDTSMQIVGAGMGRTIIDGNSGFIQDRVMTVNWVGNFTLRGVTLQHGQPPGDYAVGDPGGGGLFLDTCQNATLQDVEIACNTITWGSLDSGHGAGLKADSNTALTLNRVWIHDNIGVVYSPQGGGAWFSHGSVSIIDSTISNNHAGGFGGGIYAFFPEQIKIIRSSIAGNTSDRDGGGLWLDGSTGSLIDSTISGNQAAGNGGGIYFSRAQDMALFSDTISGNYSDYDHNGGQGGGIYNLANQTVNVKLYNNLIAGNSETVQFTPGVWIPFPGDMRGEFYSGGYNAVSYPMDSVFDGGIHNTDLVDTLLMAKVGPLLNNGGWTLTHALLSGSQLINAGNPAGCLDPDGLHLATDQRGVPRAVSGRCDIGAYEWGFLALLPVTKK